LADGAEGLGLVQYDTSHLDATAGVALGYHSDSAILLPLLGSKKKRKSVSLEIWIVFLGPPRVTLRSLYDARTKLNNKRAIVVKEITFTSSAVSGSNDVSNFTFIGPIITDLI
jgi:hypothetical protein